MKNTVKRIVAASLAVVMVMLMMPFGVIDFPISATAVTNDIGEVESAGGMGLLGTGYNMLGDQPIRDATLKRQIFNMENLYSALATEDRKPISTTGNGPQYSYEFVQDLSSYLRTQSNKTNVSIGVNAKIKLVTIDAQYKLDITKTTENSGSTSKEYAIMKASNIVGTMKMDLDNFKALYDKVLANNGNIFNQNFVSAVKSVGASPDPSDFIEKYGTHILVGYSEGGEAVVTYSGQTLSKTDTYSNNTKHEVSGAVDATKLVSIKGSYSNDKTNGGTDTSSSQYISYTGKSYGSATLMTGLAGDSQQFNDQSVKDFIEGIQKGNDKTEPMLDEQLELVPIWKILEATGDDEFVKAAELIEDYYNQAILEDCIQFYDEYLGEDYVPADDKDASADIIEWLYRNPDKVTIITTAAQLALIGKDKDYPLHGVYVLANNIDLSTLPNYDNWTPIGTSPEAAFTGKFYGNYNTIENLKITSASVYTDEKGVSTGYAGLFGYVGEKAEINNLKVEGEISASASESTYIGAVAAFNRGTVSNCYDAVIYNVEYTSIGDLNIPARYISPGNVENSTIVLGDDVGIRLSGTYENVNIEIENNGIQTPAYIILENANITGSSTNGTIYNKGNRPIYIISTKNSESETGSNSISGAQEAIAINAPDSSVYIFGDTELTVTGGAGAKGVDGEIFKIGEDGKNGCVAIKSYQLCINCVAIIKIIGGEGGDGGNGGPGDKNLMTISKRAGNGGNGGNGAEAVCISDKILIIDSNIELICGDGGKGGNGGRLFGGFPSECASGGRGGDSAYTMLSKSLISSNSNVILGGGIGGKGGNGGAGATDSIRGADGINGSSSHAEYDGHHYMLIKGALTWEEAKSACEALGGHLVTITSAEENAIVRGLLPPENIFIGMSDHVTEGTWVWVTGEEFAYTNWAPGEPNNYGGDQDYGAIYGTGSSSAGMWDDESLNRGYICEWDDYTLNVEQPDADDQVPNILSGIICGAIDSRTEEDVTDDGTIKSVNNPVWADVKVQIAKPVEKVDYFSDADDAVDPNNLWIETNVLGHIGDYSMTFNRYCMDHVDNRMGYILISHSGCKRYIPVYITRTVATGIEIVNQGPTEFVKDMPFNINGLEVKVLFNNTNHTETITANDSRISCIAPAMDRYGQKTVTICYQDDDITAEAQYKINVGMLATLDIEIVNFPTDYMTQKQGAPLKTEGMEVEALMNDGTSKVIDLKDLSFSVSPSLCTVGESTVTVTYEKTGASFTKTYKINIVANPNFDHAWNSGTVTTPATHTAEGEMLYTCTVDNCGATKTEKIPGLTGHVFGEWTSVDGETHKRVCPCGEEVTLAHEWDDGVEKTPATHIAEGEMLYTCDDCPATKTVSIGPITEHAYGDWAQHDATQHKRTCECEAVEYEDHVYTESLVTLAPTYTEEGSQTSTCTTCGYVLTEVIPAIGIENAPTIAVEGDAFVTGQTVNVRIRLKNNPGIASVKFALAYDTEVLTLTNITYNTDIGGQAQQPQNYNSPVTLNWINGTADSEGDFLFATLTFTVNPNAVVGSTTKISLTYDENDIYDITETNIEFFVEDGEFTILDYMPGDMNGDFTVNNKDISRLFQYLSGWDIEANDKALDINGDGVVNNKDLTRLFQYMSGWDVEIH